LRATRRRGASCQLNEWRRDAQHSRARSASVSGGPRGSCKVRRASGCACGAARRFCGRRGIGRTARGGWRGCTLRRAVGVCALAPAARALLRWLSGRLRPVEAGWTRLPRGSSVLCEALRRRCHHWCLNCPTLAGALRVDSRQSARLVKGAARVWVCMRLGAAPSDSARRRTARGGVGAHSGERLACVHWLPRRARCCAGSLGACPG
jgi:hypothetical protein